MTTQSRTFEIALDGTVFVETTTYPIIGGQESTPETMRRSFTPGSDVSEQPEEVQRVCRTAWTEAVVSEFERKRAEVMASLRPVA